MRYSFLFMSMFCGLAANCQQLVANPSAETREVRGMITVPVLTDLKVSTIQANQLELRTFESMIHGKLYNNYADIVVKSSRPWILTVASKNQSFSGKTSDGTYDIPVDVIMLKPSDKTEYITLSSTPQVILQSENTLIQNHYTLDLKLQPQFGYRGAKYDLDMVFVLTPR